MSVNREKENGRMNNVCLSAPNLKATGIPLTDMWGIDCLVIQLTFIKCYFLVGDIVSCLNLV